MFILFNMFLKFFIIFNLIMFSILSLFLSDLIIIWLFMEMNNFMFICLMTFKLQNKKIIFLYFLIQTIASLSMIFSLILNFHFFLKLNFTMLMFLMALNLKLGIPPFHLWMPLMSIFLTWEILFFILSIQKIIPFYMISLIEIKPFIIYFMILMSSYISMFKMINSLNFKIILTYSSINQMSWMLFLILFKNLIWLMYFIIYSMILLSIHWMFMFLKMSSNFFINISSNFQLICLLMIFNLASLPPFSFFFLKWLSIYLFLFNSNNFFIFILMLINSFILIYIYINMMILMVFFYSMKLKLLYMIKKINFSLIFFSSLFSSLIMIMI